MKKTTRARTRARSVKNERKLRRRIRREQGSVPTWKVKELADGQLGLTCPRPLCGGKALVNKRRWLASQPDYETRSCTYCYAVAWIPEELL